MRHGQTEVDWIGGIHVYIRSSVFVLRLQRIICPEGVLRHTAILRGNSQSPSRQQTLHPDQLRHPLLNTS